MEVVPFIADNPAAALAQIHARLGPEAIVLSLRPLPASGLSRLWKRHCGVEVLACLPQESEPRVPKNSSQAPGTNSWPLQAGTGRMGIDPDSLGGKRPHVFIGPAGVGKTTLLCKWLVSSVLNHNRVVRVWRLDGATANTAEMLNVYGEMFQVAIDRFWRAPDETADLCLVDLPGVDPSDPQSLNALGVQLAALPAPRVHLVLNAAYDSAILEEQFRAFSQFQPQDLSFTHLDERKRHEDLYALVKGTNCSIAFLSDGQKIPGGFAVADPPNAADTGNSALSGVFEPSAPARAGWQSFC